MHGDMDNAERCYNEALAIRKALYGDGDISVAACYNNLGQLMRNKKAFEEALDYCLKALEIRKKTLDADDLTIAASYFSIAAIYYDQGDYDNAIVYFEKCYTIRKAKLGDDDSDVKYVHDLLNNARRNKGIVDGQKKVN